MKKEADHEVESDEARFKDNVFAANPDLYRALFSQDVSDEDIENEDEFNWVVPSTEAEARELLAEMQGAMS